MKDWDKLVKFLKENRYAVLATVYGDKPVARAMVFVTMGDAGVVYTATTSGSNKLKQIQKNNNVFVYVWKDHDTFKIAGTAEILTDSETKRRILETNPIWGKHYSGPNDPKMTVIKVNIKNLTTNI